MGTFCYLCHLDHQHLIDIFGDNENHLEIPSILKQHFYFLIIAQNNNDSKKICIECWSKTMEFHQFYKSIRDIQCDMLAKSDYIIINDNCHDIKNSIKMEMPLYPEIDVNIMEDAELNYITIENIKSDHFIENTNNSSFDNDNYDDDEFLHTQDNDNEDFMESKPIPKLVIKRKSPKKKKVKVKKQKIDNDSTDDDDDDAGDETKKAATKTKASKNVSASTTTKKRRIAPINDPAGDEKIRMFFKMNCDVCGINFETFAEAKTHYKLVHKQAGYITCCDKQYFRRSRALCHITKHLDVKSYLCETCNKGFSSIQSLKHHMDNRHTPTHMKPFKCTMCQKAFMSEPKLARHISILHCSEESKKFECNECGKKFIGQSFLTNHVKKVHQFVYAQMCDICARVFKCKQTLQQHYMDQHSDIVLPKIQCELCGIWLKNKNTYRIHIGYHNDITRVCTVCNKTFPNKNSLNKHMRTVHVEKTHQCTMCEKAFKKALSLKEHIACHTGENLYTCPYCPNTFKSNSNMHKHRKKSHLVEWLQEREKRGIPIHRNPPILNKPTTSIDQTVIVTINDQSMYTPTTATTTTDSHNQCLV